MEKSRKKLITAAVLLLGVTVLIVAAIALQRPLRERYWLWKLESGTETERLEAAERLKELGSIRSPPELIDAFVVSLDESGNYWMVESWTSRLYYVSESSVMRMVVRAKAATAGGTDPKELLLAPREVSNPASLRYLAFVEAIRELSSNQPEVRALLKSFLKDETEVVRAVAASILLGGTTEATEYVSGKRLFRIAERY